MNIALPALFFFLVLLPGVLGRSGIKRVDKLSIDYAPFGRFITDSILLAIAVHCVWLGLVYVLTGQELSVATVLGLLSASPELQRESILAVEVQWDEVALYFGSIIGFSYFAFPMFRRLISRRGWDRRGRSFSSLFRFHDAPWYYLLTGADFEDNERPDYIKVSAIVSLPSGAFLYVGVLTDFFLGSDGNLDRVVLSLASRRPITLDKEPGVIDPERFYPIDGDYFVIRAEEMTTLNVGYYKFEPEQLTDPSSVNATSAL